MWLTENPNQQSFHIGKYEYFSFNNRLWVKIFYHNSTNGVQFSDNSEVLSCNGDQKYSILNEIRPYHRIDNKFEFLLVYPQLNGQFNHWRQRNCPHKEHEVIGRKTTIGYEPINISWTSANWGGLALSVLDLSAYISGSIGVTHWYYSIGRFKETTGTWTDDIIPGPFDDPRNIKQVYLFMRVRSFVDPFLCTIKEKMKFNISIHFIVLIISPFSQ